MPPRIRAPLQPGEIRRHEVVPDDDPDRARLLALCQARDNWRFGGEPPDHPFVQLLKDYVLDNLGLCIDYARKLDERHVPEEDLIHQNVAAFIDAILRFDVSKAGRVSTFSLHRQRFESETLIQEKQGPMVRLSGQLRDDHAEITKIVDEANTKFGGITDEEILAALRKRETETNLDREKKGKTPKLRWNRPDDYRPQQRKGEPPPLSLMEQLREARYVYVGPEYSPLLAADAADTVLTDERLDIMRAVARLPPKLRAAVAIEYGILVEEADLAHVAKDEFMHEITLKLAHNMLRRSIA